MTGESGTSHTTKVYHYYKCFHTRKPRTCDKKNIKKDWIENLVLEQIQNIILDDSILEYLADILEEVQSRENTFLPSLKKQLAETEKAIENMLNAIQAGIFTSSTKKRLDELEESKSSLEVQILQEEIRKPVLTRQQILFWLHRFRKMDISNLEHRQRLIDTFVNAIYVYEDKIILTFNYKEGTKTISLDEINGSDLDSIAAPSRKASDPGAFLFCAAGPLRRPGGTYP